MGAINFRVLLLVLLIVVVASGVGFLIGLWLGS